MQKALFQMNLQLTEVATDVMGGTMPRPVYEFKNDEYRNIAGFVRDAGRYEKTTVPLEKFKRVDFLRTNIPLLESDEDLALAVLHGVSLANAEFAIGFPGFIGLEGKLKQPPD